MTALRIHIPDEAPVEPTPPLFDDDPTVAQVLDWHEGNRSRKINSEAAESERRRIWGMLRAALGAQPISKCKPLHLQDFINAQPGVKSDASRKRWNATAQSPFNAALDLQWIAKNPFRGLKFPRGKRGRDWTEQEFWLILRAADRCFRKVLLLLYYSGMRPGESREMQCNELMIGDNKILLQKHKMRYRTDAPRPVPLHPRLAKFLERLERRRPPGAKHLILNSYGRPWSCQAVTKRLRRLRKKLGLPDDVKLHGLRHTFITRALMAGVAPASVMEIVGHTQMATMQGYTHLTNKVDHLAAAMAAAAPKRKKPRAPSMTPLFDIAEAAPSPEPAPLFDSLT